MRVPSLRERLASLLALWILVPATAPTLAGESGTVPLRTTADAYMGHVRTLASDAYEGRGTGQAGNDRAAEYIAEQMRAYGLQPAGVDGTWYQQFDVTKGKKLDKDAAALRIPGIERELKLDQDFGPFPYTAMKDATGPLAFVGYGIEAPDVEYDDYKGFDAKDKILLMLRYEPKAEDESAKFGGKSPSSHAVFSTKVGTAAKKGALAVLIVNPPGRDPVEDKITSFDGFGQRETYDIPMIHISRVLADEILAKSGQPTLAALVEQLKPGQPNRSVDLGREATVVSGVTANTVPSRNVIGLLPGETDELVVLGAHFDHLGLQERGWGATDKTPVIHNGADDNASGTSGMLEVARLLAAGPKLRRGILFMAYSGEELGLLGSRHFVDKPTVDLGRIKAMVNFDMIGRLRGRELLIYGTTTAKELPALVESAADEAGIDIRVTAALPGNSDHDSFLKKDIPVLFPFTGLHKQYHRPDDDWELIDADGAVSIIQMFASITADLASMEHGPEFQKPDRSAPDPAMAMFNQERSDTKSIYDLNHPAPGGEKDAAATPAAPADDASPPPMPKVRLGVVPSYENDDTKGMLVDSVVDGGLAKAAGVQDGDFITQIGDDKVNDVYGYMRAMSKVTPGATIQLIVDRKGTQLTLSVVTKPIDQKDRQ